uniref:Putative secreted protein n=1 Tax=Anopheles marajoara TaxID=58244 RepID=A0A2M4CEN4_9DIPT
MPRWFMRQVCSSSRCAASSALFTLAVDQSFSAVAETRGKMRCRMLCAFTTSDHMQASPPSTSAFWAPVPMKS